ncbi:MAG: DUF4347 domain-containing protein, partial [Chlorobium sp.]
MANTIVFIDSHIPDNESLMLTRSSAIEYRIIDEHRDGIEQMVDALAGQNGYDSIQIISHGAPGSITIGDTVLDNNSLSQYADQLATIGKALTTDGDLLLYGCNVGEGDEGHAFIEALAYITGADVAASDDLTGSATKGGDWALEVHNGTIENIVLPMAGFDGVLGNTAPTFIPGNAEVSTDFGKRPTFTAFTSPVTTTAEDHAVKISFSYLLAHSNATAVDGAVESFTVKGITSGTLTIGSDASTATVWVAAINNAIDATHDAWWTPESNANGTFVTFEVVAYDNDGAESIIGIPVIVTVSSENDAPTFINSDGKVTTD